MGLTGGVSRSTVESVAEDLEEEVPWSNVNTESSADAPVAKTVSSMDEDDAMDYFRKLASE